MYGFITLSDATSYDEYNNRISNYTENKKQTHHFYNATFFFDCDWILQ